jgi:hypothetical protein
MIRRSLFWGLTLILMGAVVYLAVQSRREAGEPQLAQIREVTQEAKPSLTRVLNPGDLQVIESGPAAASGLNDPKAKIPSGCAVSFRNVGSVPYCSLQIKITYWGKNGKSLGTRNVTTKGTIPAGEILNSGGIFAEDAPADTAKCEAIILSADIGIEKPADQDAGKDGPDSGKTQ